MSTVRLREVSALERVQLQRDKCDWAGTKFAARLREVSALERVKEKKKEKRLLKERCLSGTPHTNRQ